MNYLIRGELPMKVHTAIGLVTTALACAAGALSLRVPQARAVPSFAQQTGQPCAACHVGAFGPQLKPYARDFKLAGYTASDNKSHELPIALMTQVSFTHTEKDQQPYAAVHFGPNDNVSVDQISLFYGGRAPLGWGAFVQATYDGVGETFLVDNMDLRHAETVEIKDKDLTYGIDINNNPGVQDAWNSTPAWRFPYVNSPLARGPAASPLVDGGLVHRVTGLGAYVWYDYSLYAEANFYQPLNRVFAGRLGAGTGVSSDRFAGPIPYWRLAFNHDFGTTQALEVGGYGLVARRYPGGDASQGADRLTDWAVDANYYNQALKDQAISAHATWIHEDQNLKASAVLLGANRTNHLDSARADISWAWKDTWIPSLQVFNITGSADPGLYSGPNGSPKSSGIVAELAFVPDGKPTSPRYWLNWRTTLQYVAYSRFNGDKAHASDNNTIFVNFWLAMAPMGWRVVR